MRLQEEGHGEEEPPLADEVNESGEMAVRAEALAERRFGPSGPSDALRRLAREAPDPPAAPARASAHASAARALGGSAADLARNPRAMTAR